MLNKVGISRERNFLPDKEILVEYKETLVKSYWTLKKVNGAVYGKKGRFACGVHWIREDL